VGNDKGSTPTLTVATDGSGPFGYRWYFNGTPLTDNSRIIGSTTSSLSISNAQTSDTGNYTVVVTNLVSSATSTVTTVTVLVPPSITTQPKGRSLPVGLPTVFNAAASGSAPLSYRWQLNGTNLPGATSNNYTNSAVTTNDVGAYQLVVTNGGGAVTSSVAMLTIGSVAAWGNNTSGQALPPPGLSNVIAIAGGSAFSLALKGDGKVVAWGSGPGTNVTAGLNNIVAIAAGSTFGLAVRSDGIVQAWGSSSGTNVPTTLSNAVAVAGGSSHGMALRSEGMVVDWGTDRKTLPPLGLSKVVSIADGIGYSVVARTDGTVVTWGSPAQLPAAFPLNAPAGLSNVVSVAAGSSYALALKSDGRIVAWGDSSSTNIPANATNVIAIAAASGADQGVGFSLALRSNGLVVAWGLNSSGQTNIPPALSNVVAIAAGTSHSLALVSDGSPVILHPPAGGTAFSGSRFALNSVVSGQSPLRFVWSFNGATNGATNTSFIISNAQPADAGIYQITASNALGVATSVPAPVTVMDSAPFVLTQVTNAAVYFGTKLSLEPLIAGSGPMQFQWRFNGTNLPGAAGNELVIAHARLTNTGPYTLVVTNPFGTITSTVINVKVIGPVVAWGDNFYGQTNVPASLTNAIAIAANANSQSSLALRADGTVAAWGYSYYGQTNVPANLSNVVEIAGSFSYSLALKSDGTVRMWGSGMGNAFSNAVVNLNLTNIVAIEADSYGATFLRTTGGVTRLNTGGGLVAYPTLTNVVALASFDDGFAALRADGTVFTTGSGFAPSATSNVLAMGLSRYHGLYLKRDGTLFGWGTPTLPTNILANISNMIDVAANSSAKFAVRSDGTVATWSAGYSTSTNVPAGLANVGVLDAGANYVMTLLFARDFPPVLLPDALDTSALVVGSKGSPQWFGQTSIAHDGVDAAQSAEIGNNTASSMRLWVTGPITVSFWWKVSSETNHDFLSFSAGGVLLTNISGETGWQQCTLSLPPGNQLLVWTYSKDGSGSAGQDAGWVDQLQLIPQPPSILVQPTNQTVLGPTNVTFTVGAIGTPPLVYRWWKNGVPWQLPTGNPSVILANAVRADSGTYSVVVTNVAGKVTSSNMVLTVHVPQLLGTPVLQPDGSIRLSSTDVGGGQLSSADLANLQVQASTNLMDWVALPGALTLSNGVVQLQDPGSTNSPARFYRIVESW
jgi:alpha-tubulin suppressor-like RCC1 family protein